MNTEASAPTQSITAELIPEGDRKSEVLPRHFARYMVTVEDSIYMFMHRLVPEYRAVYWHFFEFSNGGFYMAPDLQTLHVRSLTRAQSCEMSADAAGIAACLLAFRELSSQIQNGVMARHYFQLRDFAQKHAEAGEILATVD